MSRVPIVAARSDMGHHHPTNQDAIAVQLPSYHTLNAFFAVADGISSLPNSEASSRLALEATRRVLYASHSQAASPAASDNDPAMTLGRRPAHLRGLTTQTTIPAPLPESPQKRVLKDALIEANRSIQEQAAQANVQVMGTTIAGMFVGADQVAWVFSVGDSRVYRLRGAKFTQLTQDHVTPPPGEADPGGGLSPKRSTQLSMYIGQPNPLVPFIESQPIQAGDRYLICSDGLWSLFSTEEMCSLLMHYSPDQAADRLLEEALQRGAPDNVSLIVASYRRESRRGKLITMIVIGLLVLGVIGLIVAAFVFKVNLPVFESLRRLAGSP